MLDILQKGLLAGLGVAVVTREKIMAVTSSLVQDGKITREDADKLANDLLEAGRKQWQEIQEKAAASIKGGLETMDIGSHKEIRDTRDRLDNIEKRLAILEDRLPAVDEDRRSTVEGDTSGGN